MTGTPAFPQDTIQLPGSHFGQVRLSENAIGMLRDQNRGNPGLASVGGRDQIGVLAVRVMMFRNRVGQPAVGKFDHAGPGVSITVRPRINPDCFVDANDWDPYDFIDRCAATAGQDTTDLTLQEVASAEWELLFAHCFQQALGID